MGGSSRRNAGPAMSDSSSQSEPVGPLALARLERDKRNKRRKHQPAKPIALTHGEWAQALAAYQGWYRNLEERARQRFGNGTPGALRRQLELGPFCYIHARLDQHRASKAKGLCITCYSRLRRQKHDGRRRRRYWRHNIVCGHLHRVHHGHGMCRGCYQKTHGYGARRAQKRKWEKRRAARKRDRRLPVRLEHTPAAVASGVSGQYCA
jgi:hypothetical protein